MAKKRQGFRGVVIILLAALAVVLALSATEPGLRFWREAFRASGFSGDMDRPLSIHFLDVGKADAIIIVCEGHAALLDAGTAVSGETVSDYLARGGIGSLDYAIASHPDKDHIGGMPQVLSEVETGAFLRSRHFPEEYGEVGEALAENQIPERVVSPGDVLALGGARLEILGPLQAYEETNNASLVIRLDYNGFSALFCGDIEEEAERDLVKSGACLSADLLKVPHHGSKTSSTKRFLKAVSPQYAVISVGTDRNNLPEESVLKRLEEFCPEVYRTDVDGAVVFGIGNGKTEVWTEK